MTAEQIITKLMVRMGDVENNGIISKKQWYTYYNGISDTVDDDDRFVQIVANEWKIELPGGVGEDENDEITQMKNAAKDALSKGIGMIYWGASKVKEKSDESGLT